MKLMVSGVTNCAAIVRSPSFSRSSSSTTTTIRPWRMSSIAASIVAKGAPERPVLIALHHDRRPRSESGRARADGQAPAVVAARRNRRVR
jgi:hypothetical protein